MSTTISFERPIGVESDVKELEYVSFLHQSGTVIRTDGSIRDEDIRAFLLSRHGLDVSVESVRDVIMRGFGVNNANIIDLVELTAMLIIPVVLKAAAVMANDEPAVLTDSSNNHQSDPIITTGTLDKTDEVLRPPSDLLTFASKVILHDVTGNSTPKPITGQLIKDIFISYGELELARNEELINEMLLCATDNTLDRKSNRIESHATEDPAESNNTSNKDEEHSARDVRDGQVLFDATSFARALTSDIQLYDINNEIFIKKSVDDFFPPERKNNVKESFEEGNETKLDLLQIPADESVLQCRRIFTAPSIDIAAATFRSKILFVLLWVTAIIVFALWFASGIGGNASSVCPADKSTYVFSLVWSANADALACNSLSSIVSWLILFVMVGTVGLIFTAWGSVGNTDRCQKFYYPIIGCLPFGFVVFLGVANYKHRSADAIVLVCFGYILAGMCIMLHFLHATEILLPQNFIARHRWLDLLLTPQHAAEQYSKRAAATKLNRMMENSIYLLTQEDSTSIQDTYFGHGVQQLAKKGTWATEKVGGIIWTWSNIWNSNLFSVEGVWFSIRVIASNIGQFIIFVYVIYKGLRAAYRVISSYDDHGNGTETKLYQYAKVFLDQSIDTTLIERTMDSILALVSRFLHNLFDEGLLNLNCTDFPKTDINLVNFTNVERLCLILQNTTQSGIDTFDKQINILNETGFNTINLTATIAGAIQKGTQNTVNSLYPAKQYMVTVPVAIGVGVAIVAALYLSVTYIPFVVSTIMQMRCGLIPTLQDAEVAKYRKGQESVTLLTGSLIWGTLVSALLFGLFIGLIVFLFLWQGSLYFAQKVIALLIGIGALFPLKSMLKVCFRMNYFPGFYRRQPAIANISMLAFEWTNFTLTSGIILLRMVILTVIALMSVGRIYKPFLAKGVGYIGPIELDSYPSLHMRELLAHEAHRHPYMDLLGLIYIMKLKYSKDFGKTAGSCWRIIFIFSMMPWLQKHRIRSDNEMKLKNESEKVTSSASLFTSLRRIQSSHMDASNKHESNDSLKTKSELEEVKYTNLCLEAEIERLQNELKLMKAKQQDKSKDES